MADDQLNIVYGADASQVQRELGKLDQMHSSFGEKMQGFSKKMQGIGGQMQSLGRSLTAGLTLPIVAIGGIAIKSAIDFEDSFAGVRKTVDATEPEFRKLSDAFRSMAKQIPVNVNELNRIGEAAGALGVKKESIQEFVRTMADLSVTTNLTSDQAANAFARIGNILGVADGDYKRLGSTVVALGNAGASTESEITEMALRLAGAGKTIGLTKPQVLGFASALSSVGVEADAGGSALSRVMVEIANSVGKGGEDLKRFADVAGVSSKRFKQQFETDASGAILTFIEGLGKMQTEGKNVFPVLEDLGLSEIRVRDAMLRAAGAGQLFRDQVSLGSKAWQDNSALTTEAAKRYETLRSQIQLFVAKLRDVGIELGTKLMPVLRQMLERAQPFIDFLGRAVDWFGQLDPKVQTIIMALAGFLAVIGPLLMVLGTLAIAIGAIATPVGLIVAAVVGAGIAIALFAALIIRHWDTIKSKTSEIWNGIVEFVKSIPTRIVEFFKTLPERIAYTIGLLLGVFVRFVMAVLEWFRALPDKLVDFFRTFPGKFAVGFETMRQNVKEKADDVARIFKELPGRILDFIKDLPQMIARKALDIGRSFVDGLKDGLQMRSPSLPERIFKGIAASTWDSVKEVGRATRTLDAHLRGPRASGLAAAHGGPASFIEGGGSPMAGGLARTTTANIIVELDGRTIAKAIGAPLVDEIRVKTGLRI